jgi:hypothetical protein
VGLRALSAADRAHALGRRRLHVHARAGQSERIGQPRADRVPVRADLGSLEHDGRVDVDGLEPFRGHQRHHLAQQLDGIRVVPALVGVGEVVADVAEPRRAAQRGHDRVREDVGVGVTVEAAVVRNLHPAEDEPAARREAVRVVAVADHAGPIGSRRRRRRSKTASCVTPTRSSTSSAWS